ncbi:MAG TPA: hypothetical protein VMY34_08240 [Acidimicrobiales bacterium]|nr:hypothetical protein [Acidimicrobiales bacterium]
MTYRDGATTGNIFLRNWWTDEAPRYVVYESDSSELDFKSSGYTTNSRTGVRVYRFKHPSTLPEVHVAIAPFEPSDIVKRRIKASPDGTIEAEINLRRGTNLACGGIVQFRRTSTGPVVLEHPLHETASWRDCLRTAIPPPC